MPAVLGLLSILCATASAATGTTCASLGCSTHKVDGQSCQCNFHCAAHKDCCADFRAACPNATDPLAGSSPHHAEHGKAPSAPQSPSHKGGGTGNATSQKVAHEKPPPKPAHEAEKNTKHHEHAPSPAPSLPSKHSADKAAAGKSGGSSSGSSGGKSSGSSGGKSSGGGSSGGSSSGGSTASKAKGSNSTSSSSRGGEHEKSEHEKKHQTFSFAVVLLVCATGITLPITVSIILVLRSRGVCCVSTAFQRIDRPPTKPTQGGTELPIQPEPEAPAEAPANGMQPPPETP